MHAVIVLFLATTLPGSAADTPPVDPVVAALRAATVTGIYEEPVELVGGRYQSEPLVEGSPVRRSLVLVPYLHHTGDLDGDGEEEVAAYLEENSGGTGHFLHAALFELQGDSLVTTSTHWIGDREQIRRSRLEGRTVVLDLIAHGPNDPGCCPNQLQRRHLTVNDAGRFEERREVLGEASADVLDHTAWVLRGFEYLGEPVEIEVTLRFEGERIFGSAGCNRFEATFVTPRRRELQIRHPISTKKMCPPEVMEVEDRFLALLPHVTQWNFLAGRLALLYVVGDDPPRSLVFERL